jgi:hypothetical protein
MAFPKLNKEDVLEFKQATIVALMLESYQVGKSTWDLPENRIPLVSKAFISLERNLGEYLFYAQEDWYLPEDYAYLVELGKQIGDLANDYASNAGFGNALVNVLDRILKDNIDWYRNIKKPNMFVTAASIMDSLDKTLKSMVYGDRPR